VAAPFITANSNPAIEMKEVFFIRPPRGLTDL
jgi:hypothetical protein